MPDTTLIVHVTGTEETRELPKQVVRAAIAQGQLSRSQLIWSPIHNAWKQVRELPHLLPSQQLAPAPTPAAKAPVPVPVVAASAKPMSAVARATPAVATVKAKAMPVQGKPLVQVTRDTKVVEDHHEGFSPLKWICIGLGLVIAGALGANYVYIDKPLTDKLSETHYANVTVYAHLGAFVQPGALVIHIPNSPAVTNANLVDFLIVLAHNTTQPANLFKRISLTTGVTSHYTMSGFAWKELGDMSQDDEAQKEDFLLAQLTGSDGQLIYDPAQTMNDASRQYLRDKAWKTFVDYFTGD
jgi:hypothetical protein